MRDYILLSIILGSLPIIFFQPYIGVLLWAWLSYMNPHRMAWGAAYDFPVAATVGAATIFSMLFSKEEKRIPWSPVTITLVMFIFWMSFTTLFALIPGGAVDALTKVIKIQIFTFVTIMLFQSRDRIKWLVAAIALSLAFFGVKGGIFTILTGGENRVWGPPESFIEDNNALALALVMSIPLMWYLLISISSKWFKLGLWALMILSGISIIGSYSRGALLAVVGLLTVFFFQSKKKFVIVLMLLVTIPIAWNYLPEKWFDRMETIRTYEQDASAMGRINAWWFAFNVAKDRPLVGGGFNVFDITIFPRYAPDPEDFHAAHSIYFSVLGEHGFVGLLLFLLLGIHTMQSCNWIIRNTNDYADLKWAHDLMKMVRLSLISYAVGGAFLGLAYFDLYYHIVGIVVVTRYLVERGLQASQTSMPPEQPPMALYKDIGSANPTVRTLD